MDTNPQAAALAVEGVSKAFNGITALADVSLHIAAGECLALVGESGAGKTTLLRLFNRLAEPDAGHVFADGQNVAHIDPVALRRRMGYVPQSGGLLPHWRVLRNVALVRWLEKHSDQNAAARTALELVGLSPDEFGDRLPAELSGGQRQRVAIARAIAAQPPYLLLDEAFSALDAITRADVHEALLQVRERLRITTVLVTHDLREAGLLGSRIAVLRRGRLEQIGTPAEVVSAPATPYVAELIRKSGVAA
jgi:osmoprotectant transport system ATP-binding protein